MLWCTQRKKRKVREKMESIGTGIGIGESDFRMLRQKQNYYIDKTEFIKNIIDNQSKVVLITRPRRFGKSSVADMLGAYYSKAVDSHNIFDKLK